MSIGPPADPVLVQGYRQCAEITRKFGTTYFWGAAILARRRRRHVHAVYALCRMADDIVDDFPLTRGKARILPLMQFLDRLTPQGAETDLAKTATGFVHRDQRRGHDCDRQRFSPGSAEPG